MTYSQIIDIKCVNGLWKMTVSRMISLWVIPLWGYHIIIIIACVELKRFAINRKPEINQ